MPWGYCHPCPCGGNLRWIGKGLYQCGNICCVFNALPYGTYIGDGDIGNSKNVFDAFQWRNPDPLAFNPVHDCYKGFCLEAAGLPS